MNLAWSDQVLALHRALTVRDVPHAFGGAIALNYHREPRSTLDIDVDVFLAPTQRDIVLEALDDVSGGRVDLEKARMDIARNGQARALWGQTYIDLFFADTDFHESMATRTVREPFRGEQISVLSIEDLLVCKMLFDRPKDWLDVAAVWEARGDRLDRAYIERWLGEFIALDDPRFERLREIIDRP